jgi:hypothetical protein
MPRFYFHIHDGIGFAEDLEGRETAGLAAAKEHALKGARSLMSADVEDGELDLRGRIEVNDEAGACVLVLHFRDALLIKDGDLPAEKQTGEPS